MKSVATTPLVFELVKDLPSELTIDCVADFLSVDEPDVHRLASEGLLEFAGIPLVASRESFAAYLEQGFRVVEEEVRLWAEG